MRTILFLLMMFSSAATHAQNYQGLWWKSPGGSEAGWGLSIAHQGDIIVATWFTYDAEGKGLWFSMSDARKSGDGLYAGKLYKVKGPSSLWLSWDYGTPVPVAEVVGSGALQFDGANAGSFTFTVGDVTRTKRIERFQSVPIATTCTSGGVPGAKNNYEDLWWHSPAGEEPGWGVHISQQGDTLFATWFGHDYTTGKPEWFVMSNGVRIAENKYSGKMYRPSGPSFETGQWDAAKVGVTEEFTATFTFTDRAHANFELRPKGADFELMQRLTRYVFSGPPTVCNEVR